MGTGRVEHLTQAPAGEPVGVLLTLVIPAAVDDRFRRDPRQVLEEERWGEVEAGGVGLPRADGRAGFLEHVPARMALHLGERDPCVGRLDLHERVGGRLQVDVDRTGVRDRGPQGRTPELERHPHAVGEAPEQLPLVDHVAFGVEDRGGVLRERHREVPLEVPRVVGLLQRQLAPEHVIGKLRGGSEVHVEAHEQVERLERARTTFSWSGKATAGLPPLQMSARTCPAPGVRISSHSAADGCSQLRVRRPRTRGWSR